MENKCFICKKESNIFSDKYVEKVCLDCDNIFSESRNITNKLKKEYYDKHKLCPNCGEISHSVTLMDFIFNIDQPETYKDLNNCVCQVCGNQHTTHERISDYKLV